MKDEDFGRMKMAEFLQEKPEDNGVPIPMSCIWVLATQLDECKTEKEQWDWMSKKMLYYFNMGASPIGDYERIRLKMVREMMVVVNLFDNRVRLDKTQAQERRRGMKKEEMTEMAASEEIVEASMEIYEAMSKRMEEMGLNIMDALKTMAGAMLIMIDNVASFTGANKETLQKFIGGLIAESVVKIENGKEEKGKEGGKG